MKVLVAAYACEPGKGSEPEVGLKVVLAAAERHDVWVLTRDNNVAALEEFLEGHALRGRIHIESLDLPGPSLRLKRWGQPGMQWYYDRWQRRAGEVARELDRTIDFDVVHHATFASYWGRAGVADVGKPIVWGPVGGGVELPLRFLATVGIRGLLDEIRRLSLRRLMSMRPAVRSVARNADVALVQNRETADRIARHRSGPVIVMPNATAVGPLDLDRDEVGRGSDVVFAARLIPWKGAILAVEAMRHVTHPDARLRMFGSGPEARRLAKAIRNGGLENTVELCGQVPRNELIRTIAGAGVLIHPALHEEAGLVVAEALASNTPVVTLRRGGPTELAARFADSPSETIEVTTPDAVARRMGAAVDRYLHGTPFPVEERTASPTFAETILKAYETAVEDHTTV
jgi:glycosyltransferase involved in cell wall biosynthesis